MTSNTKEDVELMLKWLDGVVLNARINLTERNEAIKEEIKTCIRASQIKKK